MVICLATAGAQEIRRPAADSDNSGAPCVATTVLASTSMASSYDASGTATNASMSASAFPASQGTLPSVSSENKDAYFTAWTSASGAYSSLSLNVNSSCTAGGTDPSRPIAPCNIR